MKYIFYKYQGAGNDFVMMDNRLNKISLTTEQIARICDRRFGVGADGLILLENSESADFKMTYYNSDGAIGSMCGNGGRCIVAFAKSLELFNKVCVFEAFDGLHKAELVEGERISLSMSDVSLIEKQQRNWYLDTGSPHLICFVDSIEQIEVSQKGAEIRYSSVYKENGVNVNFVQLKNDSLIIRTYERGVEAETLACGTGATAAAIATYESGLLAANSVKLKALGGDLEVSFTKMENTYTNICLVGAADFVFKGSIDV